MNKILATLVILFSLFSSAYAQNIKSSSFDELNEYTIFFKYTEGEDNASLVFFSHGSALPNYAVIETWNYTKSPRLKRYNFNFKVISNMQADLYVIISDDDPDPFNKEKYFGFVALHDNAAYLYDKEEKFLMKLPRDLFYPMYCSIHESPELLLRAFLLVY